MNFIKYKNEKLPLKLSFSALKKYNSLSGKDIVKGVDDFTLDDIQHLFEAAYESGCKTTGKTRKQEDVEEVLDECYHEFVELIPSLLEVNKKK